MGRVHRLLMERPDPRVPRRHSGTILQSAVLAVLWVALASTAVTAASTAATSPSPTSAPDRCAQCQAFLRHAPLGRSKACEELCELTWPDYNCNWICTRLAELHSEGSEAPCWDIGYCKEREIRELQEKKRQEEEDREKERLRREALEEEDRQRERERQAKEEESRRREEAARLEIEQQKKDMAASAIERERKLLKDEWARLQREKESVAREREVVGLEKQRIELIKAKQAYEATGLTAEERQQLLRNKAREALRVVDLGTRGAGTATATDSNVSPTGAPPPPSTSAQPHKKLEGRSAIIRDRKSSRDEREKGLSPEDIATQVDVVPSAQQAGALWCAWDCSDIWTFNGLVKILVFFLAYIIYTVALEWGEERVMSGVSEDFEAIQLQLRLFGIVSQLVAVILSGVFLFFGWMAFRHELSLPLIFAPLGQKCLTVATYVPKELYLFLLLTGQLGKRLALAAKAGYEWWVRVRRILAAQRHLQGKPWARVAKDAATLRFAEYIFLLLFLLDALAGKGDGENHACADVAAYLVACELVALLLNVAITFPNNLIRQDVLTGITESALLILLARFLIGAWGGDARLTLLSLPLLFFRLFIVVSLLRPALGPLLGSKAKTS